MRDRLHPAARSFVPFRSDKNGLRLRPVRLTTSRHTGTLHNGFVIVGIQPSWQQVVAAAVLIARAALRNDRTVHKIIIEC